MSYGVLLGLCILEFVLGALNAGFVVFNLIRKKPFFSWMINIVAALLCLTAGFLLAMQL
jgi:hypothetical protein